MKSIACFAVTACLAGLASCGRPDAAPSSRQAPAADLQPVPASAGTEVLTIRFRDSFVEVVKGPDGIHYNVLGPEGSAVATGLTRDELAARFPRQAQAVEAGLAAPGGPILDASHYPASTRFDANSGSPAADRGPRVEF